MALKRLSISNLESGGLITNYQCTSRCGHCLYRCGPRWPHDYIDERTAHVNFETLSDLHCSSVHIGGGEPLLRPETLVKVLNTAAKDRINVDYVETNSSWVKDQDSACTVLDKLMKTGLRTILISISPFHNEFIPFSKVKTLMSACKRTGMKMFPWVSEFVSDIESFDENVTHPQSEYEQRYGEDYWESLPGRYWISMGGRALETYGKTGKRASVRSLITQSGSGCKELGQTAHFHFDLYGNYIPGLCSGLSISRSDLGKELPPREYPIISALYNGGIGSLLCMAMEAYGFEASRSSYRVKCELCYEIRRYLAVDRGLDTKELQPRGHYLYG
jgi:hypothetical protein